MKVFFTASYKVRDQYEKYYKKIYELITDLGYTHVSDDIVSMTTKKFYDEVEKGGRQAQVDFYNRNVKQLQESDINIFETSVHSLGVGFLIQKSLELNKPTIVLHLSDSPVFFLMGADSEKLMVRSYSEKNLKKVLQEVFATARERRDKRFNFFLSPKLLDYLEQESTREGVTKSKLIRDLIVEHMHKNSRTGTDLEE